MAHDAAARRGCGTPSGTLTPRRWLFELNSLILKKISVHETFCELRSPRCLEFEIGQKSLPAFLHLHFDSAVLHTQPVAGVAQLLCWDSASVELSASDEGVAIVRVRVLLVELDAPVSACSPAGLLKVRSF